jgi:quercetin dioxygenase-like cupin family protein
MTRSGWKVVILAALCAVPALALADASAKGGSATLIPAADLKWMDAPGMTGVKMAVVDGDPSKGPAHMFIKFAGGFSVPQHFHNANHYVVVVSGTMVFVVGGKEYKLPAGSYFSFTGKKAHTTACEAGPDCVLFADARAKWDVVPVKAKQ